MRVHRALGQKIRGGYLGGGVFCPLVCQFSIDIDTTGSGSAKAVVVAYKSARSGAQGEPGNVAVLHFFLRDTLKGVCI